MKRSKVFNLLIRLIVVSVASIIMALNINSFVHTGGLLPGGASGLTLLIQESMRKFFGIKLSYTLIDLLINAIPVYIGFRYIGKNFTMLSCWVIVLTSILTDMLPAVSITEDTTLISIFGGLINGFAISLCLLADSTSGGTDFIAIYLSEKRGVDSFSVPLIINGMILLMAGVLFDWDKALYSIIFQFASTLAIRVLYRKYQKATLFIITNKPREVCDVIHEVSNHSATVIDGEGSYEHSERNVVYSVVNAAEAGKVVNKIKEKDKEAFVNVIKSERILGRFYQRPTD